MSHERRFAVLRFSDAHLTASIPGLWSCTEPTRQPAAWFARAAAASGLVDGKDYFVRAEAPAGGPAFVDALAIQALVGGSRSPSHRAVVTVAAQAIREAIEGPGPASSPASLDAEPVMVATGSDPVGAEPWDEAFDFGRLVPVFERDVGGVLQLTVSARHVHTFLAVGRDFSNWVKSEIADCGLIEGTDYWKGVFARIGENSPVGRIPIEYALLLPSAKKIGMQSKGRRGNAVHEYFIEQERCFLAGERPIPASIPPAPHTTTAPSGYVDDQPIDPLFMSLASYPVARGLPDRRARREAAAASPPLAASMIEVDAVSHLRLVPGIGWTFTLPFLDEW